MVVYIVVNLRMNEFWVADHYEKTIGGYVDELRSIFGKENIQYYPTDLKHLEEDKNIEINKGYKEAHYVDWITHTRV